MLVAYTKSLLYWIGITESACGPEGCVIHSLGT